jgi:cystathionine beta-lyase
MDLDNLEAAAEGAKVLLLCSPHNPVGRVWTPTELQSLGEICLRHGITIVSDEIHGDIIMPGSVFTPILALPRKFSEVSITCSSPSKTFNIPGVGCSFAVIPDPLLRKAFVERGEASAVLGLPSLFSVTAAEAAYRRGAAWLDELIPYLESNIRTLREFVQARLPLVKVMHHEGSFVVWLDFRALRLEDEELDRLLLSEARVRMNPGHSFGEGGSGFQRINIACPQSTLLDALRRIADARLSRSSGK